MSRRRPLSGENPREVSDPNEFSIEMQPFPTTTPPFLHDGDVVMLMWKNHSKAEDSVTSEGLKLANLELLVYRHSRGSDNLPTDLKMASFKVERFYYADQPVTYGSIIKFRHCCGKFINLGKEISKLDSASTHVNTSKQVNLCEGSNDSEFKILKPDNQGQTEVELSKANQGLFKGKGLYVFTLVTNTTRLILHKISDSIDLDLFYTVKLYYQLIPDEIIRSIKSFSSERNTDYKLLEQLGSLCDDHNILKQNYLRDQSKIPNINLVDEVCKLLNKPTTTDVRILERCLKALIKMYVGNFKNQEVFLKDELNMLYAIKLILKVRTKLEDRKQRKPRNCQSNVSNSVTRSKRDVENGPSGIQNGFQSGYMIVDDSRKALLENLELKYLLKLKELAVSMLEILCEDVNPEAAINVDKIIRVIGVITLHKNMVYCYQQRNVDDAGIEAAIKTHNLLKHVNEFEGIKAVPSQHQLRSGEWDINFEIIQNFYEEKSHQEAWNYCLHWSRNIEILYKNINSEEVLAKVYFRLRPEDELTPKEECIIKHKVNCGRPKDRLTLFLLGMDSVKKKVYQYRSKFCPSRRKLLFFSEWVNYFLTLWTVVMNILLIVAWESVNIKSEDVYHSPDTTSHSNGSLLNSYCVEAVCYNNSINSTTFTPEDCSGGSCVSEQLIPTIPDIGDHSHWFFSCALFIGGSIHLLLSLLMALFFFALNFPDFGTPDKDVEVYEFMFKKFKLHDYFENLEPPRYFEISFYVVCFRILYVFGFVICSAMALRFFGYYYCICLMHVVVDNTILQRVLKSFTRNFSRLFWLVVLGMVMIYIYSVGAFAFFADEFHDPEGEEAQYCNSLLQCWVTISHYILIGGTPSLPTNFKDFAIRVIIFEVTFYIVISIVGINIIYAIVVDTFIELREEIWQIERDNKQICFICQIFSSRFEKKAKGFDHHILNDHYMTNYIYYKLHIDQVLENGGTLTDIEWYVNNKIKATSIEFFPLHRARCLDQNNQRITVPALYLLYDD